MKTTPQTFISKARIGGFDDLSAHFGKDTPSSDATTYKPVALFLVAGLMVVAVSLLTSDVLFTGRMIEWFISMVLLDLQRLQDVERFASMFRNYDTLAQRWVQYGYVYPFVETGAGLLMMAGVLTWLSAPAALFVASIGAVSVFKAVYIDKRELKCACVGGDRKVPLGLVSLTENPVMVGLAIWMLMKII
ncbi:MauE/DoxX family redox-associated membrane protein [Sulfitobacter sp.]|uniref:MauE/DoxX family redox-associated membrane protein n=1 Tax=Sulfitobacter sp. TaxID=1903071 RepID=UPI0030037CB7